jgi:hypothetical protein
MDPDPSLFIEQMRVRIAPDTQARAKFDAARPAIQAAAQAAAAAGASARGQCLCMVDAYQEALSSLLLNTVHDREAAFKRFTHISTATGRVFEYPDAMMAALMRAHAGTRISVEDAVVLAVWCLNMMRPAFLHSFKGPQWALGFAAQRDYCNTKPPSQWSLQELAAVANKLWSDIQEMQQTNRTPVDLQALPGQGAGDHPSSSSKGGRPSGASMPPPRQPSRHHSQLLPRRS